jgi:hypothetical protein
MPRCNKQPEEAKALMGALVHMRPKPHEDIKVGKKKTATKPRKKSGKAAARA